MSGMAYSCSNIGDGRPLQPLSDVQLPDIIIKRRQARRSTGSKFLGTLQDPPPTTAAAAAAPVPSLEDEAASCAVAAAVQAVVEQRPDIAAAIQQATSKLNATGMFEPAVNKLRAAVQLQLKAYKQLQAHNPVLGQTAGRAGTLLAAAAGSGAPGPGSKGSSKDSVASRLEHMYGTVMQSLEQERQAAAAAAAAAEAAAKKVMRAGHTRHRRNNQRRQSTVAVAAAAATESMEASATIGQGLGSRLGSMALDSSSNRPGSALSCALSGGTNTLNNTGASCMSGATRNSLVLGSSMGATGASRRSVIEAGPGSNGNSPRTRLATTAQLQGTSGSMSLPPLTPGSTTTTAAAATAGSNKRDAPGSKGDTGATTTTTTGKRGATLKQDVRTALLGPGAAWLGKAPPTASGKVQIRQTALDVVKEHMEEAAFSAWQEEVATHREKQLGAYRAAIQAAQQQLVARQLAEEEEEEAEAAVLGGKRAVDQAPADASELTMKQLVHWLANRDVPEPEPLSLLLDVSEGAEPGRASLGGGDASSAAAQAASQRLVAARTVREMMAAAQQHIQMRQQTLQAWQHSVPYSSVALQQTGRPSGPASMGAADAGSTADAEGAQEAGSDPPASGEQAGSPSAGGAPSDAASSSNNSSDATSNPRSSVAGAAARRASALGGARSSVAGAASSAAAAAAGGTMGSARSSIAGAAAAGNTTGGATATAAAGAAGAATSAALHTTAAAGGTRAAFGQRLARAAAADGAWKASAPRLQVPSGEEVEGVPLPALPPLLDLSCEPAKVLQARLVRVWAILGVAPAAQMDMVLRYTARDKVALFEPVLSAYEAAAAAVLQREALLGQVATLKKSMDSCAAAASSTTAGRGQGGAWGTRRKEGGRGNGAQSHASMLGMTLQEMQQLFWAFLVATKQVAAMAAQLHSVSGDQLLVSGQPYPGEDAIAEQQLTKLLHDAWQLLQ